MSGVSRVQSIFAVCREQRRAALMPFITAGYPSLHAFAESIPALERGGASIVEIGFPFTDPIADGPVIAASMHQALQAGVTPQRIFDVIKTVRSTTRMGLIAMVSDSIITRMDPECFVRNAKDAGFDGLIVPDIDLEAAKPLSGLARLHGMSFTLLVAPTTSAARIGEIVALCAGFVYVLARVGITGESQQLDVDSLRQRVAIIRQHTTLPIAVGFGISRPEHVASVAKVADAAIVGSALVRRMGQGSPAVEAEAFMRELSAGVACEAATVSHPTICPP